MGWGETLQCTISTDPQRKQQILEIRTEKLQVNFFYKVKLRIALRVVNGRE